MATKNIRENLDSIVKVNNYFLNLYNFMNIINANDDNKSNCLSMSSMFNAFNLLYEGTDGDTKRGLNSNPNLKDLINAAPKPSQTRSVALIRDEYNFNESYRKKFDKDHLLDFIPTTNSELIELNNKIKNKFEQWPEKNENFYNDVFSKSCRVSVGDQSYFEGYWDKSFNEDDTKLSNFYIDEYKEIKIEMMNRFTHYLYTYYDENKDCDFISLPYQNNSSMLIVKPRKPHNKKQLINFCIEQLSGIDILNFYKINGINDSSYVQLSMPKFKFETQWELRSHNFKKESEIANKYCPYLTFFLDNKNLNLQNMVNEFSIGFDSINMISKSKIVNNEMGTFIKSETNMLCYDSLYRGTKKMILDRGFIFIIHDKNHIISNIGLFSGE